jgi:hypothetical protein
MAVSTAFRPFEALAFNTNMNGSFDPSGTFSTGTGFYTVNNGVTWLDFGTATALTGLTVPFVVVAIKGAILSLLVSGDTLSPVGAIPALPTSLTSGNSMFEFATGLTGNIPALPNSLTNASSMFESATGLTGNIPALPNSLTNGNSMFESATGLTGNIPALPNSLTNASSMFESATGLTGNIPALPNSLTNANYMFESATGLTGNIPALPNSLMSAAGMFYGATGLTGNIPALPNSLMSAAGMFYGATGLNYLAGTLATTECVLWSQAFDDCGLTSAMVNAMLADFRTAHTNGLINGANLQLGISGGTNGAPTGQGITDLDFLVALGAVITTN